MAKVVPIWDIATQILKKRNIKVSPKCKIRLCDEIAKEINGEPSHESRDAEND